jgi:hypothetical protein
MSHASIAAKNAEPSAMSCRVFVSEYRCSAHARNAVSAASNSGAGKALGPGGPGGVGVGVGIGGTGVGVGTGAGTLTGVSCVASPCCLSNVS